MTVSENAPFLHAHNTLLLYVFWLHSLFVIMSAILQSQIEPREMQNFIDIVSIFHAGIGPQMLY